MRNRVLALALPLLFASTATLPAQMPSYPQGIISGSGSSTASTAFNVIVFSGSWPTSYGLKITSLQCGRTDAGTSAIKVTLNDAASTVLVIPNSGAGSETAVVFAVPIQVAADTNLTATASAGVTTLYCSAQGYLSN